MKTTKQFSMMMAIVLLSFSIISCGPYRTITLHVDTDSINKQNLDSTSNFGQLPGVSNKDFTTDVKFGEKINWIGVSSSSPGQDKVKIKRIVYESGAEILTRKNRRNCLFSRKVKGKVNKESNFDMTRGDKEKYLIEFKVFHNGKNETFKIDPKLQVIN